MLPLKLKKKKKNRINHRCVRIKVYGHTNRGEHVYNCHIILWQESLEVKCENCPAISFSLIRFNANVLNPRKKRLFL